jgi:hypothetical protein
LQAPVFASLDHVFRFIFLYLPITSCRYYHRPYFKAKGYFPMSSPNQRPGSERRRFPRLPINLWIQCSAIRSRDEIGRSFTTVSQDLSPEGVAIWSEEEFKTGQMLLITLLLPPRGAKPDFNTVGYMLHEYRPVGIIARVAWCASTGNDEKNIKLGIQFLEITMNGHDLLKEFL